MDSTVGGFMDANDFLGSFAQENVQFTTKIIRTAAVGDNFWKVMVFVEDDRFVDATSTDFVTIPGSDTLKACTVTADTYASITTGLLQSWLYDLFINGFSGDCILVACGAKDTQETPTHQVFIDGMEQAYELMKAYAYHKTVCGGFGATEDDAGMDPSVAVKLADLCSNDYNLLSSAPYLPYYTTTPETLTSSVLYNALVTPSKIHNAFMSHCPDKTRNAALYTLGVALSVTNASSTCVGNSMDVVSSTAMVSSSLSLSIRTMLKDAYVQTWKPVGDNTGAVAAVGANYLNGDVVQAQWIVAYITYMTKVGCAKIITKMNVLNNADTYSKCVSEMAGYLALFGTDNSGRLSPINITAPAFTPTTGDEIVIDNAWNAVYVDQVRKVSISGALYIG